MHSNCAVIINRLSGTYSEKKADQVKTFLEKHGISPRFFFISNLDEATSLTRQFCGESSKPLIIVGGGDGTINGVLNGLTPNTATMAVLPFGTSNVLTRELAIRSLDDALQRIVSGGSRPVPAGLLEKGDLRRYFLLMAGIGFDGSVVRNVRFREKRLLGKGAYVLSIMRRLIDWERNLMEVSSDDGKYSCHSLIICNSAKYAGEFVLTPAANLFEPAFEALCIQDAARLCYLKAGLKLLTGRSVYGDGIRPMRATRLSVSGDKPVQIDGDYICQTPVKISIVPDFVKLIA